MGNFAGTASYYDQYRPGLSEDIIRLIISHVPQPNHLLDLGSGTGRILEQFLPHFSDAIAVEPDHDMVKLAKKRLQGQPVKFVQSNAEDFAAPPGWQASLVTICHAFHWMDRDKVLQNIEPAILPHGVIAIISDHSFWSLPEEWCAIIRDTIQEFLGQERRAGDGTYRPPAETYRQNLEKSAFSKVQEHSLPATRQWDADSIIGYLYSTSFASKTLLGDNSAKFAERLRGRLLEYAPDNTFLEHNTYQIMIAARPDN